MKRRWPVLAGLLAGGAAVGAAGALLLRRRRQQWEGYEPGEELDSAGFGGAPEELAGEPPEQAPAAQQPVPGNPGENNNRATDPAQAIAGD